MNYYVKRLMGMTDTELSEELAVPKSGTSAAQQVQFEIQRRALVAQKEAADATRRGAEAAEKYTEATWCLIKVTAAGVLVSLIGMLISSFSS